MCITREGGRPISHGPAPVSPAVASATVGLRPGQEVLLLELARAGPMIQAQLSDALGCEPPSVTLMTRKVGRPPRGSVGRVGLEPTTDGL